MTGVSEDALLPVLVAELADDESRRLIEELARAGRVCLVPVLDAPVDGSLHVLEVSSPGHAEPLVVLAEPAGAPTAKGFPLRLHPYGSTPAKSVAPPPKAESLPSVRSTRSRPASLSARHTRDLLGDARPADEAPDVEALVGRDIAMGKLVVEELVGIGGMGAVYRARHKQLDKQVAVKVLHARFRDDLAFCARFHAEALAISLSGGLIGLAIGVGIAMIVTATGVLTAVITVSSVMLAVGFSLAVGLFFGIYPAQRAAKLNPIEALRHE